MGVRLRPLERTERRRYDPDADPGIVGLQGTQEPGSIEWTRLDAGGRAELVPVAAVSLLRQRFSDR